MVVDCQVDLNLRCWLSGQRAWAGKAHHLTTLVSYLPHSLLQNTEADPNVSQASILATSPPFSSISFALPARMTFPLPKTTQ